MNLSDRKRRERREQLCRAQSKLDQHQFPVESGHDAGRPHDDLEWQDLVERRILEAMEAGAFDNLSGRGKPLNLTRNPHIDPSLELAFGLLKNNGYAPEWIARDKEIRQELEIARARLQAAWTRSQANPVDQAAWQAAIARFEEALAQLNRKIDDLNLIVPVSSCQRVRLRLTDELRRVGNKLSADQTLIQKNAPSIRGR